MLNSGVMVNSKLKDIAEAKGYKNAKRLADAMSEHFGTRMSYRSIYALWDNTADLYARGTLNRLCEFLSVPLGLLIVYEGDPQGEGEQRGNEAVAKVRRSKSTRTESKARAHSAGVSIG